MKQMHALTHMWASLTMATELHVHSTTYTQTQISKKNVGTNASYTKLTYMHIRIHICAQIYTCVYA